MFCPEKIILTCRLRFSSCCLLLGILAMLAGSPAARAGWLGISIPANYGNWFTSIYKLYLQNQDLIANARKLYTAYLTVSNTIDALEGFNEASKNQIKQRWRTNMQTLLATQILFQVDQSLLESNQMSTSELLTQILGLTIDEQGNVAISPELVEMAAISLTADGDYWADQFAQARRPALPGWFVTQEEFGQRYQPFLDDQVGHAFKDFNEDLAETISNRIMADVGANPLLYLTCDGRADCWSPFNFDASGSRVWSWDEMSAMMFDPHHEIHSPLPLDGELELSPNGSRITNYDQYLHRRVCSLVWRSMGRELDHKLRSFHRSYRKRCREILTLVHDIDFLAAIIENSIGAVEDLSHQGGGGSAAMIIATALDISAGGKADDQAKMTSYISGYLNKKLTAAKERALKVKQRLLEQDQLFVNLHDQIKAQRATRSNVDPLVSRRGPTLLAGMVRNQVPPYALANSATLEDLSAKIAERVQ